MTSWRARRSRLPRLGIAGVLALGCGDDALPRDAASTGNATAASGGSTAGDPDTTAGTAADTTEGLTAGDGTTAAEPLLPEPGASFYAFIGERVTLDGSASTGAVQYVWNFDDGSPSTPPSSDPTASTSYRTPGRYHPVLTVIGAGGQRLSASLTVTVTEVPSHVPRHDTTVVRLADDVRVAVVSPDSDELMVVVPTGDRPEGFAVQGRVATCDHPRTVAALTDGRVGVACQDDDAVVVIDIDAGTSTTVDLPHGSRPYGVIADGEQLWVTLQARGEVVHIDAGLGAPAVVATWPVVDDARGVAVLPDGRLAISRWRSPDEAAQLAVLDRGSGAVEMVTLQFDDTVAADTASGGIPSYLDQVLVSPIGDLVAVPALQANYTRGEYLDGNLLSFETTVRGIVSLLEWPGPAGEPMAENFDRRHQFDNRGFMSAGAFSSRGDYLFVAARGSRAVERIDTFNDAQAGALLDVGYAPAGVVLSADDRFLFVDAFASRTLAVYDVSDFSVLPAPVAQLPIPTAEPLTAAEMRGQQLFGDSFDPRLARDGYIACAHCHLDGEADHRTWDFTDRGEGLRNTITLLGRGGMGHGPVHWSANFDEIQDFENDIRIAFEGHGLLDDADWNAGTTAQTLGDPKAGLSPDLDDLAAYVSSLVSIPRSPARQPDGGLTAQAQAGQALFESPILGCVDCHAGINATDSAFMAPGVPILHDVGTLTEASGQRLGLPLTGLDTPTLRGIWNTAPYLHDGSAPTLAAVFTTENPSNLHGTTSMLTNVQLDQLVAYLRSLE
ncbi:MAG: hypothetical protein K0V04_29570 [Deltaproteobacteria bacterium]|nr:hypothetical protein [Deltaproteobacteria bacterium]